jgi:uncharacterized protein (TIRG00374 family)
VKRKLLVGTVFSALFLYLALRGTDWGAFAAAFEGIRYGYLVPAVFFTLLGHYSRAHRWKYMMLPVKRIPIGPLWSATAIAFMVNNLFPARIGELVRAYTIGRSEEVSKSAAFATIVYERVVDVTALILILWFCLLRLPGPAWLRQSTVVLIALNGALLGALYWMVRYRGSFASFVAKLTSRWPGRTGERTREAADAFVDGLGVVTDARAVPPIAALSIPVWGSAVLGIYFTTLAMDLHLPVMASLLLIVIITLGSMIPSAPAYVGTLQYACVVALGFYDVDRSHALAYSTVYHATQFFPITLVGLYYAWRTHLHLSDISRARPAADA